jgi:negative regulator of flagellin synthesis FlgM
MAVNMSSLDLNGSRAGATAGAAPNASATQSTSTIPQDATQQQQTQVSITSTASLLARLQQALAAEPAVDRGRVDSISRALAAGSYRINGDNIARGLIHTERALGELQLSEI